jgi:hypothetical protein
MGIRRYTIKDTKSPSMFISLFEASKGRVQAGGLGLKPTKPDFELIGAALKAKPGTVVAYELTFDGKVLSFEVSWGNQAETLASVEPRRKFYGQELMDVMRQLSEYRLATPRDIASAEALWGLESTRQALSAAIGSADKFRRDMQALQGIKTIAALPDPLRAEFRAWAGKNKLGGPILVLDMIVQDTHLGLAEMFTAPTLAYLGLGSKSRAIIDAVAQGGTPDLKPLRTEVLARLDAKMLVGGFLAERVKALKAQVDQAVADAKRIDKELKEMRKLAGV